MYETRNLLTHNLGFGDTRTATRRDTVIAKPDPPLTEADVFDLETKRSVPACRSTSEPDGTHDNAFSPRPLLGAS
jgi:hypothetical protein